MEFNVGYIFYIVTIDRILDVSTFGDTVAQLSKWQWYKQGRGGGGRHLFLLVRLYLLSCVEVEIEFTVVHPSKTLRIPTNKSRCFHMWVHSYNFSDFAKKTWRNSDDLKHITPDLAMRITVGWCFPLADSHMHNVEGGQVRYIKSCSHQFTTLNHHENSIQSWPHTCSLWTNKWSYHDE